MNIIFDIHVIYLIFLNTAKYIFNFFLLYFNYLENFFLLTFFTETFYLIKKLFEYTLIFLLFYLMYIIKKLVWIKNNFIILVRHVLSWNSLAASFSKLIIFKSFKTRVHRHLRLHSFSWSIFPLLFGNASVFRVP